MKNRRPDRKSLGQLFWATVAIIAYTNAFSLSVGDALTHMEERKVCTLDIETRHLFVTYFGIWKEKLSIKIALQP